MQLKTSATIPRAVKPSGNGATIMFSPVRSRTFLVFPAAFPSVGVPAILQMSRCCCGIDCVAASVVGSSIMTATRPVAICHSIWQWKLLNGVNGRR